MEVACMHFLIRIFHGHKIRSYHITAWDLLSVFFIFYGAMTSIDHHSPYPNMI